MVRWGQWVVGPPGSGKTTYCNAMKQLCSAIKRPICIVNLDPANDTEVHDIIDKEQQSNQVDCRSIFDIDIRDLIATEDVMDEFKLGPNGALLYSMDFIYENASWLMQKLDAFAEQHQCTYFIFDCPGQVELYSVESDGGMKRLLRDMTYEKGPQPYRMTAVHLVDSTLIKDVSAYVSALFISMNCQIMLEMPFVNLLSKVDLLKTIQSDLGLPLREYLEVDGMQRLVEMEARRSPKHLRKRWLFVSELLTEVEDTNLTDFDLVDVHSQNSMIAVLGKIDRANGMAMTGSLGEQWADTKSGNDEVGQVQLSTPLNPYQQQELLNEIIERHMTEDDESKENPN